MPSKHFTLTLQDDAASRVSTIAELTGGTVPAYAARWATDISWLPTNEQEAFRAQVLTRITQLRAAGLLAAPSVPAVPQQLQAEARTLRAQVSPQRQLTRKRRSRSSKRTGKASLLAAGV